MNDNFSGHITMRELRSFFFETLGMVDLRFYGAVGDGRTDNYANLQVAIDDCNRRGVELIFVPNGVFLYRGNLINMENITFVGNKHAVIKNGYTGETLPIHHFGYIKEPEIIPTSDMSKVEDYLYTKTCNELDYDYAKKYFETKKIDVGGGCSSIRSGNYLGRNFDWVYDKGATVVVRVPATESRYASMGIVGGFKELTKSFVESGSKELDKIMPFRIVDGINQHGVVVTTLTVPVEGLPNDYAAPSEEIRDTICTAMLPRYILDHFRTAEEACEYISKYVALYPPKAIVDMGYETHYMIADENDTWMLEVKNNEIIVWNIGSQGLNFMTNFALAGANINDDYTVYTPADYNEDSSKDPVSVNLISEHGSGLERFNYIAQNYANLTSKENMEALLRELKYTNTYSEPWYSEFVGGTLNLNSELSDLENAQDLAQAIYENRTREEGPYYGTWQTVHSVVYDIPRRTMYVKVQEEDTEHVFKYAPTGSPLLLIDGAEPIIPPVNPDEDEEETFKEYLVEGDIALDNINNYTADEGTTVFLWQTKDFEVGDLVGAGSLSIICKPMLNRYTADSTIFEEIVLANGKKIVATTSNITFPIASSENTYIAYESTPDGKYIMTDTFEIDGERKTISISISSPASEIVSLPDSLVLLKDLRLGVTATTYKMTNGVWVNVSSI